MPEPVLHQACMSERSVTEIWLGHSKGDSWNCNTTGRHLESNIRSLVLHILPIYTN